MSFQGKNKRNRLKGDVSQLMPSGAWAATHKGTAYGILAPAEKRVPKVSATGTSFYYKAWWPGRKIVAELSKFAQNHKGCVPTFMDINDMVCSANYRGWTEDEENELLNVAFMDNMVSKRVLSAVDGGVIHEALHKLYTCQRQLDAQEVYDIVVPRWARIGDVFKYVKVLLDAGNIIEDVRIERLGCATRKGIRTKMADLQDFILTMEAEGREGEQGLDENAKALMVIFGAFRDIGLGYRTQLQRDAIEYYRTTSPEAFELVTKGDLAPVLRDIIPDCSSKESIEREIKRDLVSLEKSLELVAIIAELGLLPEQQEEPPRGGKSACPKCDAPASKLRARPVANQDDKIAIVCTSCGHMEIIDKPEEQEGGEGEGEGGTSIETPDQPKGDQKGQGGSDSDVIRWDGEEVEPETGDQDDSEQDGQGEGSESEGEEEGEEGSESGAAGEGEEEEGEEGSESGSEGEEGSEEDEGASEGEESAEGDSEGTEEGSESDTDGEDSDESAEGEGDLQEDAELDRTESADAQNPSEGGSTNAGAGATENSGDDTNTLAEMLQQAIEEGQGANLMDYAQALGGKAEEQEEKEEAKLQDGERRWKPATTADDLVKVPRIDDNARKSGKRLTKSVKRECAYLLARLRQIVLGQQDTSVDDGVKKGRALSKRYLADTYVSLNNCKRPERAFRRIEEDEAPSTAASVVIDESGSMYHILQEAGMIAVAIAQPLDALGCPVQVHGIRSNYYNSGEMDTRGAHRDYGVTYDVIKDYDEPFRSAEPRFSKLQATGGTPLADGVEFALKGLEQREEDNRVMFVITDGCPDPNHEPVIRHQLRVAKEQGIHVIGVGIGYGAEYVKNLFPDYVWSEQVSELPKLLVGKLNNVMSGQRRPHSRKVA